MRYYLLTFIEHPAHPGKFYNPCGSSSTMITEYKQNWCRLELAEARKAQAIRNFSANYNAVQVWLLPESKYDQKACELGVLDFYNYVTKKGEQLA